MMLRKNRGERVGIRDGRDGEERMRGGVGYLEDMMSKVGESVGEKEGMWFGVGG